MGYAGEKAELADSFKFGFAIINSFLISCSLTWSIAILGILWMHLWWNTSSLMIWRQVRAQVSHPQRRMLTGDLSVSENFFA